MSDTPLDPWSALTRLTAARIALGRAGGSQPTRAHLAFQLAHAQARDAVHHAADLDTVALRLTEAGLVPVRVESAATDRTSYLQRPDLGRRLVPSGAARLQALAPAGGCDLAIVVADGLSGFAAESHAAPVASRVAARVVAAGWRLGPLAIVTQGRVAIGDEIGQVLGARMVLVLIGERPGLSSPDSLGAYLTWAPRIGRSDAERNCVSNIRPEGLPYALAAHKIAWLLAGARRLGASGVVLKDESDLQPLGHAAGAAGSAALGR